MTTVIHDYVAACRAGTNPRTICRVHSGWAVMGESQFLCGYSLIYPDPVVSDLNALGHDERRTLLYEASVLGDALLELTGAIRCNYEILGNLAPALHVHVFPRFENEPPELATKPVWSYDWNVGPMFDQENDKPLQTAIADYLRQAGIARTD
ncbi:MAG: hypothetical protein AAF917_14435 [Pseudomonadota bacterium]